MRIQGSGNPALNQLQKTSNAIAKSLERLSTGKRINSAKDDIPGYALSTRLDAQVRGLGQTVQNTNTALGMVNTADSALGAQLDILQRMREIAVQGANGTLTATDRTG